MRFCQTWQHFFFRNTCLDLDKAMVYLLQTLLKKEYSIYWAVSVLVWWQLQSFEVRPTHESTQSVTHTDSNPCGKKQHVSGEKGQHSLPVSDILSIFCSSTVQRQVPLRDICDWAFQEKGKIMTKIWQGSSFITSEVLLFSLHLLMNS